MEVKEFSGKRCAVTVKNGPDATLAIHGWVTVNVNTETITVTTGQLNRPKSHRVIPIEQVTNIVAFVNQ